MSVKIKLKRIGKIRHPQYRIVVADSRTKRGGRAIEEVGYYDALPNPSVIEVETDRIQYWLGVGAKPTESVQKLLTVTGDWQKFTGEGDPAGTLEVAEVKVDRGSVFAVAVEEAGKADHSAAAAAAAKKLAKDEPVAEAVETPVDEAAAEAEEVSAEALEVVDAAAEDEAAAVEATADEK